MKNVSNLELRRNLAQAIQSGRYMITVTYLKGSRLQHYLTYQRFPEEDLLPTFDHFAGEILANEESHSKTANERQTRVIDIETAKTETDTEKKENE